MKTTHEKACLCALNRIFGFEPKIALALVSHLGSASEVFALKTEDIDNILGPHSKYKGCISQSALDRSYTELEQISRQGISFIGWNEDDYPALLKECEDAPTGLYIRSTTPAKELWNDRKFIAIVGTRDLSSYGREWCERLVRQVADMPQNERPVIVSGLALGTDICAHKTALEMGIPTMAVMATGPDTIYPSRHRFTAEQMANTPQCALITDYPPGTAPLAIHFLRRNRIIAGLSEAIVLIESKIKGGGMTTARLADSYNRDVHALPGRIDDLRSQGCNFLIRNRTASPITSIEDFLKDIGISSGAKAKKETDKERLGRLYNGSTSPERIAQMSDILLAIRRKRGISIEEVAESLDIEYYKIVQLVGILETDGLITVDLLQRCFINFAR